MALAPIWVDCELEGVEGDPVGKGDHGLGEVLHEHAEADAKVGGGKGDRNEVTLLDGTHVAHTRVAAENG